MKCNLMPTFNALRFLIATSNPPSLSFFPQNPHLDDTSNANARSPAADPPSAAPPSALLWLALLLLRPDALRLL